ncbi:hypothetical protein [Roseivivax sp. THAF40]|uniref:hypothetical protein n=1 Tax=Roseivivax sp. THAF40 TaxID=2587858 RepID=UPI0012682602|nr:hypothetical protein [Roseivivax sp. THAF40]
MHAVSARVACSHACAEACNKREYPQQLSNERFHALTLTACLLNFRKEQTMNGVMFRILGQLVC